MITYQFENANGTANNGAADATLLAAQSGKTFYVLRGYVAVTTAAVGGGGRVALENGVGGTRFFEVPADAIGYYPVNFGEEGYRLSTNTALNLTVDTAVTTQATANATFIVKIV